MKGITAALAATLTVAALTGCSSGPQAAAAPVAGATTPAKPAEPAPAANTSPREALRTAIQGYTDALTSGDSVGASAYIDPACDDSTLFLAAPMVAKTAKGARVIIDSVYLDGQGGGTDKWHLTPGAPDALRRLVAKDVAGPRVHSFRLINGEWVKHPDPCDPPTTATPAP